MHERPATFNSDPHRAHGVGGLTGGEAGWNAGSEGSENDEIMSETAAHGEEGKLGAEGDGDEIRSNVTKIPRVFFGGGRRARIQPHRNHENDGALRYVSCQRGIIPGVSSRRLFVCTEHHREYFVSMRDGKRPPVCST